MYIHKISRTRVFVIASFMKAPNFNNPIAPPTRKLINKRWYFYTMEMLFNNLKSELLTHTAARVNRKTLHWVKETRHKWVYTVWFLLYETQEHATLIYGCSNKTSCLSEVGMTPRGHKGTCWGDENTLCFDCGVGYARVYICQNFISLHTWVMCISP